VAGAKPSSCSGASTEQQQSFVVGSLVPAAGSQHDGTSSTTLQQAALVSTSARSAHPHQDNATPDGTSHPGSIITKRIHWASIGSTCI
jgi:hypothetical protein